MTTNDKPTRERPPEMKAAPAAVKIKRLRALCETEIMAAPDVIRAKYAERIAKVRDELDAEARVILDRMLAE